MTNGWRFRAIRGPDRQKPKEAHLCPLPGVGRGDCWLWPRSQQVPGRNADSRTPTTEHRRAIAPRFGVAQNWSRTHLFQEAATMRNVSDEGPEETQIHGAVSQQPDISAEPIEMEQIDRAVQPDTEAWRHEERS